MPAAKVNLDALIPRDDFVSGSHVAGGSPRQTIGLSDLQANGFFQDALRKPDFQRETTHWTPLAVVDLVRTFLDGDLIPAVILWERGDEVFVIDGAHRLSALIAWIRDDYGDGRQSNNMFGRGLTGEQVRIAQRTRELMRREVGTFAEFAGLLGQDVTDPVKARRIGAIGRRAVLIQWVTAATPRAAEDSFFKINQAAQPIDPVERRILQSRTSPNAIASRCIARGGRGHKYWSAFPQDTQDRIERLGAEIYDILYTPPHSEPLTTADVPIAGQGYNALLFVYLLVSLVNGLPIPTNMTNRTVENALPPDMSGEATISFLLRTKDWLQQVSTNHPGSLGLHPLVYYYARSGTFLYVAFLGTLLFVQSLDSAQKKDAFTRVRGRFEDYLLRNHVFVSLTISRLGSGARSMGRINDLYRTILSLMLDSAEDEEILQSLMAEERFSYLKQAEVPTPRAEEQTGRRSPSRQSRSAAFIAAAMQQPLRCEICNAPVHSNSVTFDHIARRRESGGNHSSNLRPTHPYCNSGFRQ